MNKEKKHVRESVGYKEQRQKYGCTRKEIADLVGVSVDELRELEDEETGTDELRKTLCALYDGEWVSKEVLTFWQEKCRAYRLTMLQVLCDMHRASMTAHLSMYDVEDGLGRWRLDLESELRSKEIETIMFRARREGNQVKRK